MPLALLLALAGPVAVELPAVAWEDAAAAPGTTFAAALSAPEPEDAVGWSWAWTVETVQVRERADAPWTGGPPENNRPHAAGWWGEPGRGGVYLRAEHAPAVEQPDPTAPAAALRAAFPEPGYWRAKLGCTGVGPGGRSVVGAVWTAPATAVEVELASAGPIEIVQAEPYDRFNDVTARIRPPDLPLAWKLDHFGRPAVLRDPPAWDWTDRAAGRAAAALELDPAGPGWDRWVADQPVRVTAFCPRHPFARGTITAAAMKFARADELDRTVTAPGSRPARILVPAGDPPPESGPGSNPWQEMWHGWDAARSWRPAPPGGGAAGPLAAVSASSAAAYVLDGGGDTPDLARPAWRLRYRNQALRTEPEATAVGRWNTTIGRGASTATVVGAFDFAGSVRVAATYGGLWDDAHVSAAAGVHAAVGPGTGRSRGAEPVALTGAAAELRHGSPHPPPGSPAGFIYGEGNRRLPPPTAPPVAAGADGKPHVLAMKVRGRHRVVLTDDWIHSHAHQFDAWATASLAAGARTVQTGDDDWDLAAAARLAVTPPGDAAVYLFPGHGAIRNGGGKSEWLAARAAVPEDELAVPHAPPPGDPGRAARIEFLAVLPLFSAGFSYQVETDAAGSARLIDGLFAPWERKVERLREFGGAGEPADFAWTPLERALLDALRGAADDPLFAAVDAPRPARFRAWEAAVRTAAERPGGPTAALVRRVRARAGR